VKFLFFMASDGHYRSLFSQMVNLISESPEVYTVFPQAAKVWGRLENWLCNIEQAIASDSRDGLHQVWTC
jgi:hypothetical protein